jgi:glycosyltransferase involved in cell wall biosynthesis
MDRIPLWRGVLRETLTKSCLSGMRFGIIPSLDPFGGGVYQYTVTMLRALHEWSTNRCEDRFIIFSASVAHTFLSTLNGTCWETQLIRRSFGRRTLDAMFRMLGEGPHRDVLRWLNRRFLTDQSNPQPQNSPPDPDTVRSRPHLRRSLEHNKIDLMLYPYPTEMSFEIGIPYVMAVHDLQHRLQPEFPEVSANGEWGRREYLFRNGCRHATLLLADSEVGKEDILHFYGEYGVTPDMVKILPYLPACYLRVNVSASERFRVRAAYGLPEKYLFYPAQFWPHKNHARIIQAVGSLKREYNFQIPIVLCGTYTGAVRERTFHEVMSLSAQLGLKRDIRHLGYVPDEDMSALYAEAVALIMPTFFGPTNIPVLEAWALGCPVLTSDIRGIREQVGDAAVLADPRSVESIAEGIYRLWTDEKLRATLTDAGYRRLSEYSPDDFRRRLIEIIEDAKILVRSKTR